MSDLTKRLPALKEIENKPDAARDARVNAAIKKALSLEIPKFDPADDLNAAIAPLLGHM